MLLLSLFRETPTKPLCSFISSEVDWVPNPQSLAARASLTIRSRSHSETAVHKIMIYFIALFSRFAQHYYLAKIHAVFVPVSARSRFVLLARLSMDRLSTGVAKIL